jgi:phosphotransferase system enzyme I (PtsI)
LLKGIAASPGYGAGPAMVMRPGPVASGPISIQAHEVEAELARLAQALDKADEQLLALVEKAAREIGPKEAQVFEAHQLIVHDPEFSASLRGRIATELVTAETATAATMEQFAALFSSMDDEYFRERAADVRDVGNRIVANLQGNVKSIWAGITEPVVVIAHDLSPSDTAQMYRSKIRAFATEVGGRTSHAAIIARSLEIPAVLGIGGLLDGVKDGELVLVDGESGTVTPGPDAAIVAEFEGMVETYRAQRIELERLVHQPSVTPDGHRVEVAANIGRVADVQKALASGAEGIGLLRTEFLYMGSTAVPSEEEQYRAYRQVAEAMGERPVVIRTLDIGGDKEVPYLNLPKEFNPFLGYRAIRLCLDRPDLFRPQLRAILRASAHGNVKIMFPMVAMRDEVRQARQLLQECMVELTEEGVAYNANLQVGIMVEIPAAAIASSVLAHEVDFFSIGTNDLIQYTMACDRLNERISYLYQPFEPAVLRLIQMVIESAHATGKWAGMCGEMAGDPLAIPLLLGLGLDEFSMSAGSVLQAREAVNRTPLAKAKEIAREAMRKASAAEVRDYLIEASRELSSVKDDSEGERSWNVPLL